MGADWKMAPPLGKSKAGYDMTSPGREKRLVESNVCDEAGSGSSQLGAHAAISEALDALLYARRRMPGAAMSAALAAPPAAGVGQAPSFSIRMLRPWPSGART
jgi:hypothetical protein